MFIQANVGLTSAWWPMMRLFQRLSAAVGSGAVVLAFATPPALVPEKPIDTGLGKLSDVALSADGRLLAAAGASGYGVWDTQTGKPLSRDAAGTPLVRVTFSPQATTLAMGGPDGRVWIADLRVGDRREIARHTKAVRALAFGPDGRVGASGDAEGHIMLWDAERGVLGALEDGAGKAPVMFLGFAGPNALISLDGDMNVVTWDVSGKRPLRRGGLQSGVTGRTIVPASAGLDASGSRLVVGAQLISAPRGGALAGRSNLANPGDLRRDNVVISYSVATGVSADPVVTRDFRPDAVVVSPGGCYALFTSFYRNQPRLHIWGLIEKGDDLLRADVSSRASVLALDAGGHYVAAATETGQLLAWRVSGVTSTDCEVYARSAQKPGPTAEPKISVGSESDPLIKSGSGVHVAVVRFDTTGLSADLGAAVADMVSGQLSNSPGIIVVERAAIDAILKEMELQRSGLTTADAVKIGKGLNAKKVVLGRVTRFGEDTYVLGVRVVDVETQQAEGSREVRCDRCKEQDLPAAVEALRRLLVR